MSASARTFRDVLGDVGDRFWVLEAGEVVVVQGGREISRLGPGASFGELALIRDIPRTASVVARTDVELYALDREAFLLALTASPRAANEASRIAASHLKHDQAARDVDQPGDAGEPG